VHVSESVTEVATLPQVVPPPTPSVVISTALGAPAAEPPVAAPAVEPAAVAYVAPPVEDPQQPYDDGGAYEESYTAS